MGLSLRLKLNGKILLSVLTAALVMFSVISLFTVIKERNQMLDDAERTAHTSVSNNLSIIANGLWNFDKTSLQSSLTGLTLAGSIFRAEIWENSTKYIEVQRHGRELSIDHIWTVPLLAPDGHTNIGSLHIYESHKAVDQAIFNRSITEVISQLLEICGLAGILLIIIHQLVIRHIETLSKAVNANRKGNVDQAKNRAAGRIILNRGSASSDELDTLAQAINGFYHERVVTELTLRQEIAERKSIEAALQASEANLSEALKISNLAYCEYSITDREFRFNSQYYSLHRTNATAEGGLQMTFQNYAQRLLHPDDQKKVFDTLQKAIFGANGLAQTEARIICADSEMRWMAISYKREQREIDRPYQTIIGVHQDITDSKQAEQQRELIARLTAQKEAAELANQAKSRFLAAASHDLRRV